MRKTMFAIKNSNKTFDIRRFETFEEAQAAFNAKPFSNHVEIVTAIQSVAAEDEMEIRTDMDFMFP
tara:strand:- start:6 stop:203 length:198 start_codon:yes stop_codon:yes gene_type:complete